MLDDDASFDTHIEAKSVRLSTGRTSLRLEPPFWASLRQVARAEKVNIGDIVERAAREWPAYSRSAAVRVYLTEYYRKKFCAVWSRLRQSQPVVPPSNAARPLALPRRQPVH